MKLTARFSLSHGFVALATLAVCLLLLLGGASHLLRKEIQDAQFKQVSAFALEAKEALLSKEEVAVLNYIRMVSKDPLVVYAAYIHPSSSLKIVYPPKFDKERVFLEDPVLMETRQGTSVLDSLSDGTRVEEWLLKVEGDNKDKAYVRLAFSEDKLKERVNGQLRQWMGIGAVAGAGALVLGLIVSWFLAGHLVAPLRKISEGTHLVRAGRLNSLVEVNRPDEIGDLARDFNTMVVQLKELDEMKRDFVSGVTHDLGTPLHAIRSAINFLQAGDGGPLTEKQSEYLLMVSNSTSNLTSFINNLLTTARIEAAKVEPFPEPVDVFAHVKELVDLYQPQAREKGINLSLIKKAHYISLVADTTMFRQIVLNLLSNGLKFTTQGEVDVILSEEDGDFVLEVRDTGIGIDPQFHQAIFEKFYRVKQPAGSPARQGSGLGLTIVKGLVEAHGGRVSVISEPGKGSTFKVVLPKQPRRF